MDKAHDVQGVEVSGDRMTLIVDGRRYEIDIPRQSGRLARATEAQRRNVVVSPSGYGLHWPDIDEDLSIDGLIGIAHTYPVAKSAT